jgi:hypothetical protein
MIITVILL